MSRLPVLIALILTALFGDPSISEDRGQTPPAEVDGNNGGDGRFSYTEAMLPNTDVYDLRE